MRYMVTLEIGANEENQRLDRFLRKYLSGAPLSVIYKAIRKDVKVNGKRAAEDTMLVLGDQLTLYLSAEDLARFTQRQSSNRRAKRQFAIAYEDENLLAAEKPFGLLTHGDQTEKKNHLANQVVDYLIAEGSFDPRLERTFTPAPVNRLDRNTTGLVLFGKNAMAMRELNRLIRERGSIAKYYLTIVGGHLDQTLTLEDRMVKDVRTNKVTVLPAQGGEGLSMETIASPIAYGNGYTLTQVHIITGRTHQIRAQLAHAGYPVIGDVKYGDRKINGMVRQQFGLSTQLLHAYRLAFDRIDGPLAYLNGTVLEAKLPPDFIEIRDRLFKGGAQ